MKLEKLQQFDCEERIWSIDWHPGSEVLATAGQARKIQLWRLEPEKGWSLYETIPTSHSKSIRSIKFSHKGNALALASFDATISIFMKGQNGFEEMTNLEGHENEVKSVAWSPNDSKFASCSRDKNVWIWSYNNISNDFECETILEGHDDDVKCVIWLDADLLASASYDNTIRLWAEQDGDFVPFQVLEGHTSTVWSLSFHEKSQTLYSCGDDNKVIKWTKQNATGNYIKTEVINEIHTFPIYTISIIDQDLFVTGAGDNTMALVSKGQVISREEHGGDVNCVATKGNIVASGGDDEKLTLWKIHN